MKYRILALTTALILVGCGGSAAADLNLVPAVRKKDPLVVRLTGL